MQFLDIATNLEHGQTIFRNSLVLLSDNPLNYHDILCHICTCL